MKQKLDKVQNYFVMNKKLIRILLILCILGIITGSFYTVILNVEDKQLVKDYIQEYISNLNKINYKENFIQLFSNNFFFLLFIWLLGVSVIGLPIILFLYFCKSFILGFSISSFIISKGLNGALLSFFYIFPCQVINIGIYLLLMNYALSLSIQLIFSFFKKKEINFKPILKKYSIIFIFSTIIMLLSNLCEIFLMPKALKFILKIIK